MVNEITMSTTAYALAKIDLDRSLEGISSSGFKFVELCALNFEKFPELSAAAHVHPENMSSSDIKKIKNKISDYGLECISISGHVDVAGSSKAKELLKKRVDLAESLGAKYVNTGAGEAEGEENINRFYQTITELSKYCGKKDIIIAVETHGELTGTGEMCAPVMKKIDSSYIGVNYDPANVRFYHGVDPIETKDLEKTIDYVVHFHVKDHKGGKGDYNFPPIGEGDIDFKYLFNILKVAGYKGPYSAEIEFTGECKKGDRLPEFIDKAAGKALQNIKKLL